MKLTQRNRQLGGGVGAVADADFSLQTKHSGKAGRYPTPSEHALKSPKQSPPRSRLFHEELFSASSPCPRLDFATPQQSCCILLMILVHLWLRNAGITREIGLN